MIGGRTLHKTTLAACLASDPSYARGWVCDVCSVDMGTASEALWHAAPHEQESGGFDCCDACASKHRLLQLSKEELVERLLAAQAAAAVAVTVAPQAAVAAVAAPAPVATEMVLFRGQTLTRTNIAEVMRSEPQARYEAGWICDGCSTKSGNSAHVVIYHGAVEPSNPLKINAFDLCEHCATDVPAAERRYQAQVDRAAERERQRFRDEWRRQERDRGGRRDPFGGGAWVRKPGARMLFPHSGRHGFDDITPDATVPTPDKAVVCAMLRRESQLRNAAETQRRLDELNPEHPKGHAEVDGGGSGDEKQPETMAEALEMIAALRTQLQHVAAVVAKPRSAPRKETASFLREASCDKEVFESIKARVVREFGLGPECVDVLNSAVTRFPGDPDIVASANYLKFNRAVQGSLRVGDTVPMDDITLASLDGHVASMRELLTASQRSSSPPPAGEEALPVVVIAGSIT